jgi:hypothetical protein
MEKGLRHAADVRLQWLTTERAIPILPAEGLAVAKTFYVDRLGFKVTFKASEDGTFRIAEIALGTMEMTLDSPMNGHGRNACVALQVDDADRYSREWSSKVDILRAPKNEDWGAYVRLARSIR